MRVALRVFIYKSRVLKVQSPFYFNVKDKRNAAVKLSHIVKHKAKDNHRFRSTGSCPNSLNNVNIIIYIWKAFFFLFSLVKLWIFWNPQVGCAPVVAEPYFDCFFQNGWFCLEHFFFYPRVTRANIVTKYIFLVSARFSEMQCCHFVWRLLTSPP